MPGQPNSKKKLLLIKDFLLKYSDEENIISTSDIIKMLEENDIKSERKSVYNDIELLIDYGLDIIKTKTPKVGYYVASRDFELVEIRLLIDAVQSAGFITANKTKKLVQKIGSLCSENQMKNLSNKVYIENRIKGNNEFIYYAIDTISRAIDASNQIECVYEKSKSVKKLPNISHVEKQLILNPYALIWSNDHYYLVANNPKYDNLMHLRVDRIKSVSIIENSVSRSFSEVSEYKNHFDIADYSKRVFNMFSGEIMDIELECNIEIHEQVFDRFGEDIFIRENFDDKNTFFVKTQAAISDGLIDWIMQFSDKIKVILPIELRQGIEEKAKKIIDLYSESEI